MIRAIQQTSMVDYPGNVCTTLFYGGCNFSCPWCHNADLVKRPFTLPEISIEEAMALLLKRKSWIKAVCLSGGEPTLDKDLLLMLEKLKENGFKVKLDTNGSQPQVLGEVLAAGLIDYIAMDIKAPPKKYHILTGVEVGLKAINESINLIKNSSISYEFRTTIVPGLLNVSDFIAIGNWLVGAKKYTLQQFRPCETLINPDLGDIEPYSESVLKDIVDVLEATLGYRPMVIGNFNMEEKKQIG
ncbi:MAG: pyruvate formate lyase activating enzyme [Clostridia bacterium]|nr:pyruvate formate lyase activating enzyme [Clostridia bacterium]